MHQYLERQNYTIVTENLFGDRIVNFLYSHTREHAPKLFNMVTGPYMSHLLGVWNFDVTLGSRLLGNKRFLQKCGVNLNECVDHPSSFTSAREIFERKIKYWIYRPMEDDCIVSPADSRVIVGSLSGRSQLFIKDKFFQFEELLGKNKNEWLDRFLESDFAIFRLTPDKYHYNHTPVAGKVIDFYEIDGVYHSCNPGAIVELATPYSKNRRIVTIIDTDVEGGSKVGMVAMIEVVALMIGEVVQCYSETHYNNPQPIEVGMMLRRGVPKSMYRPGSSTDILLFEKDRVDFCRDLHTLQRLPGVQSRFTKGFGQPLAEVNVNVRATIGNKSGQSQ